MVQIGGTHTARVVGNHGANLRSKLSQAARMEGTHGASLRVVPSQMTIVGIPPAIGNLLRTSGNPNRNSGSLTKVSGRRELGRPTKNIGRQTKRASIPRGTTGKQENLVSQPTFVMPCRAHLAQKCTHGSRCKFSHSRIMSLSDVDYGSFIDMACPLAENRDVKFLWSLSKSERLVVVNEGEMANVDSIEKCCIGRIRRAKIASRHDSGKRAKFDAAYVPPLGGNQIAAARAAAAVPDTVGGDPPGADSATINREPTRASRQEDRPGAWRTGMAARWNNDKGYGFIKPEDCGADVFCP